VSKKQNLAFAQQSNGKFLNGPSSTYNLQYGSALLFQASLKISHMKAKPSYEYIDCVERF